MWVHKNRQNSLKKARHPPVRFTRYSEDARYDSQVTLFCEVLYKRFQARRRLCGSGLARDTGDATRLYHRVDAFASKLAPTQKRQRSCLKLVKQAQLGDFDERQLRGFEHGFLERQFDGGPGHVGVANGRRGGVVGQAQADVFVGLDVHRL